MVLCSPQEYAAFKIEQRGIGLIPDAERKMRPSGSALPTRPATWPASTPTPSARPPSPPRRSPPLPAALASRPAPNVMKPGFQHVRTW